MDDRTRDLYQSEIPKTVPIFVELIHFFGKTPPSTYEKEPHICLCDTFGWPQISERENARLKNQRIRSNWRANETFQDS